MSPFFRLPIIAMLLALCVYLRNQRMMMRIKILNKRPEKENFNMQELVKKFIDKECILYTFSGTQIVGVIKEVCGDAVLIENKGKLEAVNISFVMRIREYPKKENGKKRAVVLD